MTKNTNDSISFLSLNVKGMRDSNKRTQLFQWIVNKPHSEIFLQENHSTKEVEPQNGAKIVYSIMGKMIHGGMCSYKS